MLVGNTGMYLFPFLFYVEKVFSFVDKRGKNIFSPHRGELSFL